MTKGAARFVHLSTFVVSITGLIYAWMRYLYVPAAADDGEVDPLVQALGLELGGDDISADGLDELFGASTTHPWEPWMQWAHVLAAPLMVFAIGWIWQAHVWQRVRSGFQQRRTTGVVLAAMFLPMTMSAYALQTSVDEDVRTAWLVVHVATSLVFVLGYGAHLLAPRKRVGRGDDQHA